MRKDLIRRLEKLEMSPHRYRVDGVFFGGARIGEARRSQLAENERVVEDWYIGVNDRVSKINERVTADASDVGFNYKSDGSAVRADDPAIERETIKVGRSRLVSFRYREVDDPNSEQQV